MITKMMTLISSCAMALALTGTAPALAANLQDTAAGVYRLHLGPLPVWGAEANAFNCSAVAISGSQLVTAAHCIPTDYQSKVLSIVVTEKDRAEITQQTILPFKVLRLNRSEDTAFIELKSKTYELPSYVDIAASFEPTMGDPIYALGYPRGDVITLTEGMYTATVPLDDITRGQWKGDFYKTTIPITGGSSGGGLFTRDWNTETKDWDYKLVGLASAGYRDVSFQNYFSHFDSLQRVMRGLVHETEEVLDQESLDNLMRAEK